MRGYLRLLPFMKGFWPLVFLGFFFSCLYAGSGGLSLPMLYPILGKLFNNQGATAPAALSQEPLAADFFHYLKNGAGLGLQAVAGLRPLADFKAEMRSGIDRIMLAHPPLKTIGFFCILGAFLFTVKYLAGITQRYIYLVVQERLMVRLYRRMFGQCMDLPLSFYQNQRSGELISRYIFDAQQIKAFSINSLGNVVRDTAQVIIYFSIAILISAKLLVAAAIIAPPVVLIIGRLARALRRRAARIQEEMAHISHFLNESFTNVKVIIGFGRQAEHNQRFVHLTDRYLKASVNLGKFDALANEFTPFMMNVLALGIGFLAFREVILGRGGLNGELFIVFLAAVASMMQPLLNIGKAYNELKKGTSAVERVFALIDKPITVKNRPDAVPIKEFREGIDFKDVWFAYRNDEFVLKEINMHINKGEIIALVGPSGGGKSTVADLLARFHDPSRGKITLDSKDLSDLDLTSFRQILGIVTQEPILFDYSIRENLLIANPQASEAELEAALSTANALDFVRESPQGLDTLIGERGVRLSGGQKQRLCIARALLANPQILIFDEATSALDNESEFLVQQAIERLVKNRTTLVIAHRLSTVRNASRIVVVDQGRISASGAHEELLTTSPLYKKLYEMQFRVNEGEKLAE